MTEPQRNNSSIFPPEWRPEWQIETAILHAETTSCRIWKATITGETNTPVIIKALKPAGFEELRGAYYLKNRAGHGAIRLLDMQINPAMMLLEYAGDYDLKTHLDHGHDQQSILIAGDMLKALHAPVDQGIAPQLLPLEKHFHSLFQIGKDLSELYGKAAARITKLLQQPHPLIALHGDLHHENIIRSPRGWLAIDPHGLCGDPAFDCANLFYNPRDRDDLCLDMQRARHMAQVFAQIIGTTAAHILDYAFCYGCLSAAWHREDSNHKDEQRQLTIAAALRALSLDLYP